MTPTNPTCHSSPPMNWKRFRAIVVIAEREAPIGNERSVRFIDYRGGITTCVGLAMRGQAYMLNLAEGE
jgi:hypothetical protein